MIINFDPAQKKATVQRGPDDPKLRKSGYGSDIDSGFWYAVNKAIKAQGHDSVKKLLSADGHLRGDDKIQYVRARNGKWLLCDPDWMLRSCLVEYNEGKEVVLAVHSTMKSYTVTWTMEFEATSFEDAVLQAHGTVSDPDNTATCFRAEETENPENSFMIDALTLSDKER